MNIIIQASTILSLLTGSYDTTASPQSEIPGNREKISVIHNLSYERSNDELDHDSLTIDSRYKVALDRLPNQAAFIKQYAKTNNFNTEYCFLVDMSIPSGKKRFFIYNMKTNSIESSSLVAHGWGSEGTGDQLIFSNTPNSCQTSLGKYKVGYPYKGTFGKAYKIYGLDDTNSKAFDRAIVLHSYSQVPDVETYPENICHSAGCPMVSPSFLAVLGNYIGSSSKPILLWIYN